MGVSSLPKAVVTRQRHGRRSNSRPLRRKSNVLTITLPSHPKKHQSVEIESTAIYLFIRSPTENPDHATGMVSVKLYAGKLSDTISV